MRKLTLGSRAFWLRQMRQWHWISAAICLVGTLLFAITGITLNHASRIEAKPVTEAVTRTLPADLLTKLKAIPPKNKQPLPADAAAWLQREMAVQVSDRDTEWSAQEIYVSLPRPGGDAWLSIDLASAEVRYERTSRGWISYLNDLHKGRHTGPVWSLFLDVFAVACVVFCVTGLVLLQLLSPARPSTWPMVGIGIIVPMLIAIFFIH